ncbi:Uncharacterised protein [Mycobacteroides abscessus subsp. abscessus]|nr:Uncharacterised protein [Mycobacteroides abscessus subsp. abscessus]
MVALERSRPAASGLPVPGPKPNGVFVLTCAPPIGAMRGRSSGWATGLGRGLGGGGCPGSAKVFGIEPITTNETHANAANNAAPRVRMLITGP